MRTLPIVILLCSLAACDDDCHHCGGGDFTPVFTETERNDDPLTANHFGVLHPGDHFFIDGFVRDDLVDPFDGFAFTAGEPLHVDFQLFIGNAFADLDVCLYDPQLDETLACWATTNDPEQGGVDVFAGGLDFHLVVESFTGDASYSLEIAVLPLLATTAEAGPGAAAGAEALRGVDARAERTPDAERGYRKERPVARPLLEIEQVITVDEESGLIFAYTRREDRS
jgi:hypothetical protein